MIRYKLRTLLILTTLLAVFAALCGPAVARAVKERTGPKRHTPVLRKWLDDWKRYWHGDDDEWHGGVI
jgi:hypothetical protein